MIVTLSQRTEAIVRAQLATGRFATPDEVVNSLIEAGDQSDSGMETSSGPDEESLKSSLLTAVHKPTQAYRKGEFVELAERIVAETREA